MMETSKNNLTFTASVIDLAKEEAVECINLETYANHIIFSPQGGYSISHQGKDVAVIDVQKREIIEIIPVEETPH